MSRVDSPEALLAEIRGQGGVRLESIDAGRFPQPEPVNTHEALSVAPLKDDRPLVRRADDKFSTFVGGKGFRVVVFGEYYALSPMGQGKIRKPYEIPFNVPALEGALSLIASKLLDAALKKLYPDAVKFRTHDIKSVEPLSSDTAPTNSLQYMDRDRLERHVSEHKVPLNPADYPKLEHLREACIDHHQNKQGFEAREARKQAERREHAELMRLNPDLDPEAKKDKEEIVGPKKDSFLA